jgi:Fe-S cluster assembly ATP-binding protein
MLKLNSVHVSVEEKAIVKDLNLIIKPREIHVVMGPNGSGKSTLAYALAGHPHYSMTNGEVTLDGNKLTEASPDERAKTGLFLAFQYPVAVDGVSVLQFLKTSFESIHGPIADHKKFGSLVSFRDHVLSLAQQLGLPAEMLNRSINSGFSGGEKKRVEILQLLVLKPKYAILDETDSGLDIDSIKLAALGVKQAIKEFSMGCLVITHYQRILKYLKPDVVHVMVAGEIVETGAVELVKKLEKEGYKKWVRASD